MSGDEIIQYRISDTERLRIFNQEVFLVSAAKFPFSQFESRHVSLKEAFKHFLKRELAAQMAVAFLKSQKLGVESGIINSEERDFRFLDRNWLVMNKRIYGLQNLSKEDMVLLPALVPNRTDSDIWAKRKLDANLNFLFTFVSPSNVNSAIIIEKKFWEWYKAEVIKIKSDSQPIMKDQYRKLYDSLKQRSSASEDVRIPSFELFICGYASSESYSFFADTDGAENFAYALYTGRWYHVMPEGVLSFKEGILRSYFKNATSPMAALPSFKSYLENCLAH